MAKETKGTKSTKPVASKGGEKKAKFNFDTNLWPMGAKVAYTAERVAEHKGMTGTIVGYRPTNGLWVKFPNGKGSISVKTAKLVGKAPQKAPSRKAKVTSEPAAAIAGGSDSPVTTSDTATE